MARVPTFVLFAWMVRSVLAVTSSGLLAWSLATAGRDRRRRAARVQPDLFRYRCLRVQPRGGRRRAASDPGPVFVRQQVVDLYGEVLADLGDAADQLVGVVTFGTGTGAEIGPLNLWARRPGRGSMPP